MSQQDDLRNIVNFLKDQKTVANSPVERHPDIDDEKLDPRLRERAAQWYASELLKKKTLTPEETKYLGQEITKHLRESKQ